ncbi:lipopolysaccharide biosynthesis protein [Rossellomorea aquimaris]|uniref:lipopolysaccharide biosynthesis protein n=1 Tax=Rossellomorea TaxID=2837508 RepID=UPI0016536487|nr:oligosaccharide flippase family protein [Rossellomorea aquimaris]
MKNKILKLIKKPFVRNVAILTSGTAAAQLVGLASSPIITRLYGPESYGLMGTFMAIVSIIAPVAALTFPIAIVLPKKERDAIGLIRLSLIITISIAVISALVLLFYYRQIAHVFRLEDIANYLFLIPFVILCAGFLQVVEQWFVRTKQYAISAKVSVLQAILINGGKVGIGFVYPVTSVLIVFSSFARGLKALLMILFARRFNYKQFSIEHTEKVSLKTLFNRHKDFPMYRAPEVFLNSISGSLPILLLTSLFGPSSAAFYSIGRTVLSLPTQLIGKSVGDVFYPRISEAANVGENLTKLIKKATLTLAVVGSLPFGIVIILGPILFSFVFGEDWATAGEYARWIALWTYFGFMNRPSVMALPVLSAQAFHLIYTIIMLITRIVALTIGFYIFSSDKVAIALFGISGALLNIGLILITMIISKKYDKSKK